MEQGQEVDYILHAKPDVPGMHKRELDFVHTFPFLVSLGFVLIFGNVNV